MHRLFPREQREQQQDHLGTITFITKALQDITTTLTDLSQQRAWAVNALRQHGLSYSDIARATGLSKARIAQIARTTAARNSDATRVHQTGIRPPALYRIDLYTKIRGSLMTDPSSTPINTTFDLTLLDQDTHWTDEHGTTHPIDELDQDSCTRLARWLLNHARHFYLQALPHTLLTRALDEHTVDDMVFLDAATWMRTRPLHQALTARQDLLDRVGPVCSAARAIDRLGLNDPADLDQLAQAGEVLVLTTADGVKICPLWQFTRSKDSNQWGTRHAARAMLIHLRDVDPWAVAALFNIAAPELDDRTPRDVIADRKPPIAQLETLARHFAAEARA